MNYSNQQLKTCYDYALDAIDTNVRLKYVFGIFMYLNILVLQTFINNV